MKEGIDGLKRSLCSRTARASLIEFDTMGGARCMRAMKDILRPSTKRMKKGTED